MAAPSPPGLGPCSTTDTPRTGPAPLSLARISRPALADRFHALSSDPGYRRRAAAVGDRLQAEDGCGTAVEALEELTTGLP